MEHYNKYYKKVDSFWLTIRCSIPNNVFDIPRWHRDGSFFTIHENEKVHKFTTVLQGKPTLFITNKRIIEKYNNTINKLYKKMVKLEIKTFEKQIKYENKYILPKLAHLVGNEYNKGTVNNGLIFEVGSRKNSIIHSEPPIKSNRIFLSILPGTFAQINEFKQRRNK
jgi:hypothetical protein